MVVFVKNNFLPGPLIHSSFSLDPIDEKKNVSTYIYSSPLDEHDENKNLLNFGINQTMFLSSSIDDSLVKSSSFSSTMFVTILVGIILFTITVWTILGNILVILAFVLDKQIRQGGMSNYLIINLAISDLLLGIAVLPFSASYSTFAFWYFGKYLCEFWLAIDVLCSTASIWVSLIFPTKKKPFICLFQQRVY